MPVRGKAITLDMSCPFFYAVNLTVAANGSNTQPLIMDNDSEFDLYSIGATTDQDVRLAAATAPIAPPDNFTLLLTNQSSSRQFMNTPINRGNICGIAFSNITPYARCIRFPRKTQLLIQVNNLIAAQIVVQITLIGWKWFNRLPGS